MLRISCENAKRLFNVLLSGKIDVEQRRQVKEHLRNCESCVFTLGGTIAEAIHIRVDGENAPGQGQGRTVHFEYVAPATVNHEGELLFTMRPNRTPRGWVLLYKLSNTGALERLPISREHNSS